MRYSLLLLSLCLLIISSCNNDETTTVEDNVGFTWENNIPNKETSRKKKTDSLCALLRTTLDTFIIKNQVYYIVEGDLILSTEDLYDYCYNRLYSHLYDSITYVKKKSIQEFTVSTLDGVREVWPPGKKLTYAVLKKSFPDPALYDSTVKYMNDATSAWMNVCNIQFEHLQQYDSLQVDTDPVEPVLFYVQYYRSSRSYIAKAFFPSDAGFLRKVYLQPSFYGLGLSVNRTGILRHELGHVLGARHEHIWSQDGCTGEGVIDGFRGAEALTQYDPYSVMHYICGNAGTRTLELTNFDIAGSQQLYGKK